VDNKDRALLHDKKSPLFFYWTEAVVTRPSTRVTGYRQRDIISLTLMLLLILGHLILSNYGEANAQFFLPPPPTSDRNIVNEDKVIQKSRQFPSEFQPPTIALLTKKLMEGKNVIRISVTSEAPINNCKIKFHKEDMIKTVDCVLDKGTVYKALIDARSPYQIIEVYARDIYGDSAANAMRLNVLPQPPIQDKLWNFFSSLFSGLRSMI
jgi:hypothetical protein